MITLKDIKNKTMTESKREFAKLDIFAYYVGRPISYVFTWPLLYTKIKPNTISYISFLFIILGFVFTSFFDTPLFILIGWLFFFLWNIFDGVDGNIARYKGIYSKNGGVIDAASGYLAMFMTFLAYGATAYHFDGLLTDYFNIPSYVYLILGSIAGLALIYPRLIMHKKKTTVKQNENEDDLQDRTKYGFVKTVVLNFTSVTGFVQVFSLICVILAFFEIYLFDIYIIGYFCINLLFMLASIYKLFKE